MRVPLYKTPVFRALIGAIVATLGIGMSDVRAQVAKVEPDDEEEVIIVQATRSGRRVQDEPIRVEVINREEIEEKILMVPGNISMMVAETGGLRVQVTSPAMGSANVRVRGLNGRYTQLLADGLPLYGGQASSIGLLQIPPTDLGRVEIIKGAASALYGGSSLGGIVNLISRRPGDDPRGELLLNATTRNGQDVTGYAQRPITGNWSTSITGGAHRQTRQDFDDDGWADMPAYERFTFRPRLFWAGDNGAEALFTLGAMNEVREGGTLDRRTVADGTPFVQSQDSQRFDAGVIAEMPIKGIGILHLRTSGMTQKHRHQYGLAIENDRHSSLFGEVAIAGGSNGTSWLAGGAFQLDSYVSKAFSAFNYSDSVPGIFAQIEYDLSQDLTLAASARADFHSDYGTQFSPRVSVLYKPGHWTIRASAARGFYAPTPFVDEIEDAGLSKLEPLSHLKAETAVTASLDIGYALGSTEINASVFGSQVSDGLRLNEITGDRVALVSVNGATQTSGLELLVRQRWHDFSVTASYVHIDATEPGPLGGGTQPVPRTPRHTGGLVAMWEQEGKGRVGFEAYYTGRQQLDDNPYRSTSRPYFELGMLGELILGNTSLFVNLENILGIRQTKYDPLLRTTRAADGRWSVDVWAPTEGFVVNAGIRLKFGS